MKHQFKRTLITLALCSASLIAAPTFASGIPTVDVAAIAQMTQQLLQLKQQYDLLRQQYETMVGSYGRGEGMAPALEAANVVPGSWQDVVAQQKNGSYGSKQQYYEKLLDTLPPELFQNPKGRSATSYQLSTDSVRAAMAGGEALYTQVQKHLDNLNKLSRQVDQTTNVKDAQDLQNRIQVENGLMQSALGKMNAMTMNLQANMVNQQNQSKATNQRYFKW